MNSKAEADPAKAAFLLGRAWLDRGQGRIAAAQLERALSLQPDHPDARRYLAYALVLQGEFAAASEHLGLALQARPDDESLRRETPLLRELAGIPPEPVGLPDHPGGKLRFMGRYQRTHHRSGWRYAMEALHPLHSSAGVRFEGFLEDPFAWEHHRAGMRSGPDLLMALRSPVYQNRLTSEERRIVPYREPWVGFLHNPPLMPPWFHPEESPQAIFAKPVWRDSLEYCAGLFALSEYAGEWLRKATGKPVSVVLHPTETPDVRFDFERFLANPAKRIVQIGWWPRRLGAIDRLPIPKGNALGYTKLRLVPGFFSGAAGYLGKLRQQEFLREGPPRPEYAENTVEREHLPDEDYDRLLAENIVFVDLYDASANNAVIECLARATPILVNRLPAVEEYLGADYPLYFSDHAEAAAKALDLGRLRAAHDYLLASEIRRRLDGDSFRRGIEASEVYRRL
jgi:tetratricopeptide (TPR) repeat protein